MSAVFEIHDLFVGACLFLALVQDPDLVLASLQVLLELSLLSLQLLSQPVVFEDDLLAVFHLSFKLSLCLR